MKIVLWVLLQSFTCLLLLACKLALAEPIAEPVHPRSLAEIHSRTKPHLQNIMGIDDVRHLLMRTGFGAAPSDVVLYLGKTRQQGIDAIVAGLSSVPESPMPAWVNRALPAYHSRPEMTQAEKNEFNKIRDDELKQLRHWWISIMLQGRSPQTERLVLFWHDLFATNYFQIGKMPVAMARQNQTFRELGTGSWAQLLKAMIRDPALLRFLNAGSNHKTSPNENLARELMELFVLGEGSYEERTVKEAARALTGHDTSLFYNQQFLLKTQAQDREEKELFGQRGHFNGDALVDVLLEQEQAPAFLATRFWQAFVADSHPSQQWLSEQASMFRRSGLNITTLYRNVLQSNAFWHQEHRGAMVKSPVDLVVGTARTLNYPIEHWQKMARWQSQTGMLLFAPPNVAGWKEGGAFITPGRLLNRAKVVRQLTRTPKPADEKPDHAETEMMQGDMMQSEMMQSEMMQSEMMQDSEGRTTSIVRKENPSTITASAVHLLGANKYQPGKLVRLTFALDNVSTPANNYSYMRFIVEKKPGQAITIQTDSFSCWPDCVNAWPDCSLIDEHFKPMKRVTLHWLASGHELWSDSSNQACQFHSLHDDEKILFSTWWAALPELLKQAIKTQRVQNQLERFLPSINAMQDELQQASINISDTPYGEFATTLDVNASYKPAAQVLQPLEPPSAQVKSFSELLTALTERGIDAHELMVPALQVAGFPDLVAVKNRSVNGQSVNKRAPDKPRPENYLNAILEHPLFQLK